MRETAAGFFGSMAGSEAKGNATVAALTEPGFIPVDIGARIGSCEERTGFDVRLQVKPGGDLSSFPVTDRRGNIRGLEAKPEIRGVLGSNRATPVGNFRGIVHLDGTDSARLAWGAYRTEVGDTGVVSAMLSSGYQLRGPELGGVSPYVGAELLTETPIRHADAPYADRLPTRDTTFMLTAGGDFNAGQATEAAGKRGGVLSFRELSHLYARSLVSAMVVHRVAQGVADTREIGAFAPDASKLAVLEGVLASRPGVEAELEAMEGSWEEGRLVTWAVVGVKNGAQIVYGLASDGPAADAALAQAVPVFAGGVADVITGGNNKHATRLTVFGAAVVAVAVAEGDHRNYDAAMIGATGALSAVALEYAKDGVIYVWKKVSE